MEKSTIYRPALLPGGGVSLRRALGFLKLMQDLAAEAIMEHVERAVDEAAREAVTPTGPQPVTVADHLETPDGPAPALTGLEAFTAVVRGGKAPAFAAIMVQAVEPDGAVRDVTEEEALGDAFPADAFAEAWTPFFTVSTRTAYGLLGGLSATASS